jgi:tetratricopeptide (TPR) repeat protein
LPSAVLAAALASFAPGKASAQTPTDYYHALATGTGGLQVLEQLHVRPGQGHLQARRYDQAFGEAQYVLKLFPNHPQGLILLVQTCAQWRSPKCALEDAFQKAIAINPKAAGTYTTQGIYLYRKGRYNDAIKSLKQALELDPSSVNAQYTIGLAYLATRQYELANEHAQRAYALGAPFPALRTKLEQAGHWKPIVVPEPGETAEPREEAPKQ